MWNDEKKRTGLNVQELVWVTNIDIPMFSQSPGSTHTSTITWWKIDDDWRKTAIYFCKLLSSAINKSAVNSHLATNDGQSSLAGQVSKQNRVRTKKESPLVRTQQRTTNQSIPTQQLRTIISPPTTLSQFSSIQSFQQQHKNNASSQEYEIEGTKEG